MNLSPNEPKLPINYKQRIAQQMKEYQVKRIKLGILLEKAGLVMEFREFISNVTWELYDKHS